MSVSSRGTFKWTVLSKAQLGTLGNKEKLGTWLPIWRLGALEFESRVK